MGVEDFILLDNLYLTKIVIMVFCGACDKYLELLHGEPHPVQCEQNV